MIRAIVIILGTIAIIAVITAFMVRFFGVNKITNLFSENQIKNEITTKNTAPILINESNPTNINKNTTLNIPLNNSLARITKKPFGIKINPQTSPVQPERFSGFHTGTDFEIFENELNKNVEIKAVCDGDIIQKTSVNGYGGVIIQKCQHQNNPILVLYGHINPETFTNENKIKKGDEIASLSPDNSPQSGYERKHLHLGVIKGEKINYRGYVQSENELRSWINPEEFLK